MNKHGACSLPSSAWAISGFATQSDAFVELPVGPFGFQSEARQISDVQWISIISVDGTIEGCDSHP